MPISPTAVRVETWWTSPLKTSPSGVRTSTSKALSPANASPLSRGRGLAVGGHLVDAALHVEGALGEVVVLAVEDLAEASHRLAHRHVLAAATGELLGDEERLREEALDLACPGNRLLVLVGELVDAEDRDDVLQLLVALQHLLDLGGGAVMVLADDVGLEARRGRIEGVDRRVDPFLGDRP